MVPVFGRESTAHSRQHTLKFLPPFILQAQRTERENAASSSEPVELHWFRRLRSGSVSAEVSEKERSHRQLSTAGEKEQ